MSSQSKDIVDLHLQVIRMAPSRKALLVTDGSLSSEGKKKKAEWIPISQIEYPVSIDDIRIGSSEYQDISLPEWLAKEKGFI